MSLDQLLVRVLRILLVPADQVEVIWVLAPLLFGLVMINMYFGKYKTEKIGWNTAFSNSMSLMWVSMILFRHMHENYGLMRALITPGLQGQVVLVWSIAALTLFLGVANYTHSLPKGLAFFVSSAIPTTIFAYLGIVIVMGSIPVDVYTVVAGILIWLFVEGVFRVYRKIITSPKQVERVLAEQQKKANIKKGALKRSVKSKLKKIIPGKK